MTLSSSGIRDCAVTPSLYTPQGQRPRAYNFSQKSIFKYTQHTTVKRSMQTIPKRKLQRICYNKRINIPFIVTEVGYKHNTKKTLTLNPKRLVPGNPQILTLNFETFNTPLRI